ncbi:MAG: hypothetical protein ACLUD2_05465 [Clostridium sp.]
MQTLCKWSKQAQTGWLKAYYEDPGGISGKGEASLQICRSRVGTAFYLPGCPGKAEGAGLSASVPVLRYWAVAKVFENVLQRNKSCLSILSAYHPDVDEAMNDKEIFISGLSGGIRPGACCEGKSENYPEGERNLPGGLLLWNVVLNTKNVSRHAGSSAGQNIQKDHITVENMANYVSMPCEEETLIIFSHVVSFSIGM